MRRSSLSAADAGRRSISSSTGPASRVRSSLPLRPARRRHRARAPSPPATTPSTPPDRRLLAAVERTSLDNLASTLSDGTLAFQLQRLAELPLAAIVVEARYSALFKLEHANGNWLADQLTRLQVRYPGIPIFFADTRRDAEDWTHRFLTTTLTDTAEPS